MTTDTEEFAEQVQRIILQKIADNTLELPAMRQSVVKCLSLLNGEEFSLRSAASTIEEDPVLSARVLWVANSAAFVGPEKARAVLPAVTRIGANNLRTILLETAIHSLFESSDARIGAACRGLWLHSRAVAVLARDIAASACLQEPDDAYVAGLLHDVGKPVIASLLLKSETRLRGKATMSWFNADVWVDLVQKTHRTVGTALAKTWRLPESVVSAASNCEHYDDATPRSAPNCVRFANAIAKEQGIYVGRVEPEENEGVLRVGQLMLGLGTAEVNELREGLRDRIMASFD